jgi:hypothetical protein
MKRNIDAQRVVGLHGLVKNVVAFVERPSRGGESH